ncbi:MAG: radical SAM protein [Clostridia bacterium]|nr:radical SAM protein [Clostridia bacterium]
MSHCNKKMLSFFLTTKCNLCCRYCYNVEERNRIQEQTISFEIAKAAVDWYFENNVSRHIRFYGPGEPTQEFEMMKEITAYAKRHPNGGNRVTVEIQTNGVFTKEVREWALENINIMWMSFDGMKDIQDYYRPLNPKFSAVFNGQTSAEVLESNVKWLIEHKKSRELMVGARVTINKMNVNKQIDTINYFFELGIRYVWTDPLFCSVGNKPVCDETSKLDECYFGIENYVKNYIDAYKYSKEKGVFWGSFFAVNFDGESDYHCRCCTPLSAPHITVDGYISACDMVLLGANPYYMKPFVVGKWNSMNKSFDLYSDKIITLNNRRSTVMQHCEHCSAKMNCGGYCLGETVNETGSLYGNNKAKCDAIIRLYKEIGKCEPYDYLHP